MTMLLESKFFLPRSRQETVFRPRLLEQMHAGLQRKLILVLAQAGFGKTTLVAHWLNTLNQCDPPDGVKGSAASSIPYRVAWLSLDENDNDPLRFIDYLVTALHRADASIGQHARLLLSSPQPPANLEPLVISLINDLTNLSEHLILTLDDYHVITSREVHDVIQYFITHAPDLFHLILASRVEPPLPLTRMRLYRELIEIREDDLRFTLDEAMTYLLETMHCAISPAEVAAIEQRTEGWIVGLHLAALSLQSERNASTFIVEFTGSHAYIVDYLTEEVLHRQAAEIQDFLFHSSLLTRFCGPLCDAVMQRSGSQKILERLERSHLFIIPLDDERGWYRYHHLFAEMLRRRAQEHDLRSTEIYRRATQWYVEQGLLMEAVEYALAAGDGELAAGLMERTSDSLVTSGQFVIVLQWLNRLPPAVLRSRPLLCAARARIAMRQHELNEAEKWLELTWRALDTQQIQDAKVVGDAHAIRVDIALNRGKLPETIQLAKESLAILPEDLYYQRGEILLFLAVAYFWNTQYAEAADANSQAVYNATRAGDVITAVYAGTNNAHIFYFQGRLHDGMRALEQALAFATERNVHQLPGMGSHYVNRSDLLYEWNMLAATEASVLLGIDLAQQARNPRTLVRAYSRLIFILCAQGREAEAEQMLQQAIQTARQYQLAVYHMDECTPAYIYKWLADGNLSAISEWIQSRGLSLKTPAVRGLENVYYWVARYLAAHNDLAAALTLLEDVAESAQRIGKVPVYLQAMARRALLLLQMGDSPSAQSLLTQALEVGEPQSFIRTFVDEGPAMRVLLAALQPRVSSKLQRYIGLLLDAFAQPAQDAPQLSAPSRSPNPESGERLSERELEVLRLVDKGFSDSEIAKELVIAVGTVKRHLNNIYGKLGVHNRTQALARAHTLKLL